MMKLFNLFQKGQDLPPGSDSGEPSPDQPIQEPDPQTVQEGAPSEEVVMPSSEPAAESAAPEAAVKPERAASEPSEEVVSRSPDSEKTEQPISSGPALVEKPAPRHSWFYRFLNFMLGRDTRVGRILRPFLRWAAAITGLFALGLLAGYLLLYQPTQQNLDAANEQLNQQKTEMERLQAQITVLQNSVVAADQAVQAAQVNLSKAEARNNLLVLIYDVANARTYLAQKDGAKVMTAIDQARTDLTTFQPYLVAAKKDLSDELNGRLETVRSVLVRDAQQAQVDLDSLYNALLAANQLLFGAK
jgi:hypothetical protein